MHRLPGCPARRSKASVNILAVDEAFSASSDSDPAKPKPSKEVQSSRHFIDWLRPERTPVTGLYDTVVLPGARQPMAVGFKTNEIERLITVGEEAVDGK